MAQIILLAGLVLLGNTLCACATEAESAKVTSCCGHEHPPLPAQPHQHHTCPHCTGILAVEAAKPPAAIHSPLESAGDMLAALIPLPVDGSVREAMASAGTDRSPSPESLQKLLCRMNN